MKIDLVTVLFTISMLSLLIERVFYYRSVYKKKNSKVKNLDNPGSFGERIASLETDMDAMKENNDKDHSLIRGDIEKLFTLFNKRKK